MFDILLVCYSCKEIMFGINRGETIYRRTRWLTLEHDIRDHEAELTQNSNEKNEVLRSYKHQCTVHAELLEKGKE